MRCFVNKLHVMWCRSRAHVIHENSLAFSSSYRVLFTITYREKMLVNFEMYFFTSMIWMQSLHFQRYAFYTQRVESTKNLEYNTLLSKPWANGVWFICMEWNNGLVSAKTVTISIHFLRKLAESSEKFRIFFNLDQCIFCFVLIERRSNFEMYNYKTIFSLRIAFMLGECVDSSMVRSFSVFLILKIDSTWHFSKRSRFSSAPALYLRSCIRV